jgi:competence protein ComFC
MVSTIKKGLSLVWYEQEEKCLLCAEPSPEPVCRRCQAEYFQPGVKRCVACGKLMENEGERCRDCLAGIGPQGLAQVVSLGQYKGAWRDLICRVKYSGQPYLLGSLADYLTKLAIKTLPPPDAVIPVPLHPNKLKVRGFNQTEVLASLFSWQLGITLKNYIIRIRDTKSQTSLGRTDRIQNLRGAFAINPAEKVRAEIVWLVDDVTTTGATLGECASVLKKNGVQRIYAICLGAGKEEQERVENQVEN